VKHMRQKHPMEYLQYAKLVKIPDFMARKDVGR